MRERNGKENKAIAPRAHLAPSLAINDNLATMNASDPTDFSKVFGKGGANAAAQGGQLMLSPPPEDQLRTQTGTRRVVSSLSSFKLLYPVTKFRLFTYVVHSSC